MSVKIPNGGPRPVLLSNLSAEVGRKMTHLQGTRGVILALALLTAFPCVAQNRVSLDVGPVTVWLGMLKSDAIKKYSEAGYKVLDNGDALMLSSNGNVTLLIFQHNSLIFASRDWSVGESPDEAQAVIGAVSALAEKTKTNACTVSHDPLSEPGISVDRVFIQCGHTVRPDGTLVIERSVMITVNSSGGKRSLGVVESIGENSASH
jgi:hypothetical protein